MAVVSDWDKRMLGLAEHVAAWGKDPSTKCGAVITDAKHRVLSVGFNGFPRGVADDARLDDREEKYPRIVHAEVNAILNATGSLDGATLYVWPLSCCTPCAAVIIQSGITTVKSIYSINSRWQDDIKRALLMLDEADVGYELYDSI